MADQLTPFMTSCYGNKQVKTPNLDRLCREGVLFERAYTPCPLCAPARASMMTSKLPSELNCYDNATPFASDEPTFAHYLKLAGYDTVLSGKMHFLGPDQLHGFHTRLTTDIYPASYNWQPIHHASYPGENDPSIGHHAYYQDDWFGQEPKADNPDSKFPSKTVQYTEDLIFPTCTNMYVNFDDEAYFRAKEYLHGNYWWDPNTPAYEGRPISYGIGREKPKEPFFLCVSTHNPHDPFLPPKKYWDMYEGVVFDAPTPEEVAACPRNIQDLWVNAHEDVDRFDSTNPRHQQAVRRAYAALTTYIDDKIGELLEVLDEDGSIDNTLIVFTSDHGDMLLERGMIQKRNFHEWATRIPLLMRLPNHAYAGTVVHEPCSLLDLGMTFRELTGTLNINHLTTDGISLMEYLRDPQSVSQRDIFIEFHADGTHWPCYAVVREDYKLIYIHEYPGQLFNLKEDPKEMHNLIDDPAYQDVVETLRKAILDRFDPNHVIEYFRHDYEKKLVIDQANSKFGEDWDYTPIFPGRTRGTRTMEP